MKLSKKTKVKPLTRDEANKKFIALAKLYPGQPFYTVVAWEDKKTNPLTVEDLKNLALVGGFGSLDRMPIIKEAVPIPAETMERLREGTKRANG